MVLFWNECILSSDCIDSRLVSVVLCVDEREGVHCMRLNGSLAAVVCPLKLVFVIYCCMGVSIKFPWINEAAIQVLDIWAMLGCINGYIMK